MAEEASAYELEGLENQLESLLSCYSSDALRVDSKLFCSEFCKLVEEYASHWQVPLPQLRILEIALVYFTQASSFFTSNCDHVVHTLSSLALSIFELLLFFDQKNFHKEPLKNFTVTFQECYLALARHQNVHLLQVDRLVRGGGPWASLVLQAILSDSSLPQNEVDGCISSELPVFFELRVRYLLSCERVSEALALAKCCAQHPTAGQHLFFLQVYLVWLYKTSQCDRLLKEVADLNGKDAVYIICSLECEEKDDLLLALSRAFLSQQLRRGDVYYLCDLVFIWSKLHSRLNTSKQVLLEESHQLLLSATNVNSIFPFIRTILQELGEDGVQFCVELCASALESCHPCEVVTKSLIYKTIAGLLPNDLEVCRACALLVFFLERSVEAYKMVYLLYVHPDQEYHVECSPIGNHVRFEMLQVLKKDLYFDPEFWNLIALQTNCLKLMSETVVSAVLEEIMEEKWIPNYCAKEPDFQSSTSVCQKGSKGAFQAAAKKRHHKEDSHRKEATETASRRLKAGPGKTQLNADHAVKKKGNQGSRPLKEASTEHLRRSFWQLDKIRDNVAIVYGEHRRTTRLSEKNPPKRRIRKPKWLLEDSGTLEENNVAPKIKKHGLKHQKHHRSSVMKRSESGQLKNSTKLRPSVNSHLKARENNCGHQRGFSFDCVKPATPPQVILELSLPDNELMGTFPEDTCNRHRGFPQILLYKPTVKFPATSQSLKTVHRNEVVLRARDAAMFVQQLHCYVRRQKGKGVGLNVQGSVSTITRSSVQGSPPKDSPRELCEKPAAEMKGSFASPTPAEAEFRESPALEKGLQAQATKPDSQKSTSAVELFEKSAAEVKPTTASETSGAAEVTEIPALYKVPQAQTTASAREHIEDPAVEMKVTIASQALNKAAQVTQSPGCISKTTLSNEVSQTATADSNQMEVSDDTSLVCNISDTAAADCTRSQSHDVDLREQVLKSSSQAEAGKNPIAQPKAYSPEVLTTVSNSIVEPDVYSESDTSPGGNVGTLSKVSETLATYTPTDHDSINDISALTFVTEMVTELAPVTLARDLEHEKHRVPGNSASNESTAGRKPIIPHRLQTTSRRSVSEQVSTAADVQGKKRKAGIEDVAPETSENSGSMEMPPESEESKLEYSCMFCHKVFKGSRVVAHAMFHFRKDECMFCGAVFKDDLLAMMHLSGHIEKLKRSKDSVSNKAQNQVFENKEISTHKTSAKAKTINASSGHSSGKLKKSAFCPESVTLPDSMMSEPRKLRSNDKPVDGQLLQEKKQNTLKHINSKSPVHKVNGHIGRKQELDRAKKDLEAKQPPTQQESSQDGTSTRYENFKLPENQNIQVDSSASSVQVEKAFGCFSEDKEAESLQVLKTAPKQNGKFVEEKNVEPQERVCCPVDGCAWFTDLSKKRVALLYHALENHYGDVKPLELAFRIGNSKCSICMRVLWSFRHFLHHVERHRLAPRHPCLHQGCTARFKTGMEMRRHARKHSPLQAVCCLPGCSQRFICLWALNLHEREHFASKPSKPDKNTSTQTDDKIQTGKKQDHKSADTASTTVLNKTESVKAARKLRAQAMHNLARKNVKAPTFFNVRTSLLKQGLKERNDSNVLKNLSNKDTSTQPTVLNLRLRQTLRKGQATNTTLAAPKTLRVISSLFKHSSKVRHRLKQVKVNTKDSKRRGHPPKSKTAVYDENTSAASETVKEKPVLQKDLKRPARLVRCSQVAETSNVSNKLKEKNGKQAQDEVRTTETTDELKANKAVNKLVKKNHVKQKGVLRNTPTAVVTALNHLITSTSADGAEKLTTDKMKKLHKVRKHAAPKENGSQTASSDSSKSKRHKVINGRFGRTTVKKKCPSKSKSVVPQVEVKASASVEDEKANTGNTDSTQNNSGKFVPAVAADSLNETTASPTTSGDKTWKLTAKSNKSHIMKKEKNTQSASSDSGKANKKHRNININGDRIAVKVKRPRVDQGNTSAKTKIARPKDEVQQPVEAKAKTLVNITLDEVGKVKEEASDATFDSTGPSAAFNGLNEKPEENVQKVTTGKKSKKSNVTKITGPNKASKKRKDICKESSTKIVKKKCKDQRVPSASKKLVKSNVEPLGEIQAQVVENSVGEEGNTSAGKLQSPISSPTYSLIRNGEAESGDKKSTVCMDTLATYSKRPYMRLPPTAYLDEKFITMPKRRKIFDSQWTQRCPHPEQASVITALQRQRCASCFATFPSAEELQSHLQLQKCSNPFGFDSDDEGNS